jgi:hypothetical protein
LGAGKLARNTGKKKEVLMKTSKMLQFICFLLITVFTVFAQTDPDTYQKRTAAAQKAEQIAANLPSNEKKINSLILDKANRMIDENAKTSYLGIEMSRRYSDHAARVDGEGRIRVKISMFENASKVEFNQLKSDLGNLGVIKLSGYYPGPDVQWYPEIVCFIPYEKIKDIAKDSRIANITVSSDPVFYAGSALTEGDSTLFAKVAREQHDVDGGRHHQVKVGVISDGIIGYDTSQANYDLPISLTWLQGHNTIAGKEGRAMLEIVHDLAPGADLMFGSADFDSGNATQMINTLGDMVVSHNCDVMVDDVGWPDEPWFLDGPLAQQIWAYVDGQDITYISSAGNNALEMWTGYFAYAYDGWLDFYHEGTANIQNRIRLNNEDTVSVYLQWQDNWQDSENNYDLYVFDQYNPETPVGEGGRTVQGPGEDQHPLEVVVFTNNTGLTRDYDIQVKQVEGAADRWLKVWALGKNLTYTHPSSQSHPSEQVVGHAAAHGVISVAAYPWYDDSVIEDFSSCGPTKLRDEWGYTIERKTPTITATDGVETSV